METAKQGDERSAVKYDLGRLHAGIKPVRVHHFARLRSTNDHAAELRRRRVLFAPAVVVAARQTAGRGRGQHTWWSGPGSVTATFAFGADTHLATHHVPLIAGLAVRDALTVLAGDEQVRLKWPNDVVYCDRKLAGLLCERVGTIDLIGVGVNVNLGSAKGAAGPPRGLRETAVWLSQIRGKPVDLTEVLIAVGRSLQTAFSRRGETAFSQILARYDRHHALFGRRIAVSENDGQKPLTGTCEGLDRTGRLLVRTGKGAPEAGLRHLVSGTVRLV